MAILGGKVNRGKYNPIKQTRGPQGQQKRPTWNNKDEGPQGQERFNQTQEEEQEQE